MDIKKQVIDLGGKAILTGTVERGTYSEEILKCRG
jgi:hypothetical protein